MAMNTFNTPRMKVKEAKLVLPLDLGAKGMNLAFIMNPFL